MKLIPQYIEIMDPLTDEEWLKQFKKVELAYRNCYKSEDKITDTSWESFIPRFAKIGHESPLEHVNITVSLICSRAIQQELTRHRLAAYSIESTRYVNYLKKFGGIACIKSSKWDEFTDEQKEIYEQALIQAERYYNRLLEENMKPEIARDVLPLALKSQIIMSANVRQWKHIFENRKDNTGAHSDIRQLTDMIYQELVKKAPVFFA